MAKSTLKRDQLVELECSAQKLWEDLHVFECDAYVPASSDSNTTPPTKFMATFPFPYMNGALHLGHSFSLSKAEFAISFERLRGKATLWPFGFHATGQPIKACADKLMREVALFGPNFDATTDSVAADLANVKLATPQPVRQWKIMESLGVPRSEIASFVDPLKWLEYFPPRAITDIKRLGCKVDWRRSFITTDINPYFDSFVRWQFNRLRALNKIKFGERYTIWSPRDNEPCMDHDRASGEGVGPQEYTIIKIEVLRSNTLPKSAEPISSFFEGNPNARLFLVAATMRPETMYGQTNCYVSPSLTYGVYRTRHENQFIICTERSALNMSYQNSVFVGKCKPQHVFNVSGEALIGLKIRAPLAPFDFVHVLPMETILPNKGTGVVTSVPADSPDDCAMLRDLQKKPDFYKIDPAWVTGFDPVPVLSTPAYGAMSAPHLVDKLKIASPRDRVLLDQAKDLAYNEGFHHGTMTVGEFKGMPVSEAKGRVRQLLIERDEAYMYAEPEREVIARSGDSCVVNLCDQWYLDYGEPVWREQAREALNGLKTFHEEVHNQFQKTLDWLNQWACARSFGLGTRLPWDPKFLIESLSDSTIYMAYYTVCHFLHSDIRGSQRGSLDVDASEMTDEAWDYVFGDECSSRNNASLGTELCKKLDVMRREFMYFYPMDLRVSGKDLISNHLTFMLYNHVCMFPKQHWPRAVRVNGLLLLNSEKMSKSTGNFMTMGQAIEKYGADATRMALADAGDSIEDANFVEATANAAVLRLHTQLQWVTEIMARDSAQNAALRDCASEADWHFADRVFFHRMHACMNAAYDAYDGMLYRGALQHGFFELQDARDAYRETTQLMGIGMLRPFIETYIELQTIALAPICPHWAEHVWRNVLKRNSSIMQAGAWPARVEPQKKYLDGADYLRELQHSLRQAESLYSKKNSKVVKSFSQGDKRVAKMYVARAYPAWQCNVVERLRPLFAKHALDAFSVPVLRDTGLLSDKRVMPFVTVLRRSCEELGAAGFDRDLSFDEHEVLFSSLEMLKKAITLDELIIIFNDDEESIPVPDRAKASTAVPGKPFVTFEIVKCAELH